ncbi:MAG TPA: hypothetical protein VF208_11000 [Candidatus Binatia bacterium]
MLIALAAFAAINPRILGLFHDDGIYAVVAKAVADGEGYRIISLPGEPSQTKYPFLYSSLLSLIWRVSPPFPGNIVFLKLLNVVILLAVFLVSYVYYRRSSDSDKTLAPLTLAAIVCTNPLIFSYTDYVLSELLLVLLSVAMLAACRYDNGDSKVYGSIVIGVIAGMACLTRLAALPLAAAGFFHACSNRRVRGGVWFIGILAATVAPWFFWVAGAKGPIAGGSLFDYYVRYDFTGGRGGELAALFDVVTGNARYLADSFLMLYLTPLVPGLVVILAGMTTLGMISYRRHEDAATWSFLIISVLILLFWPFQPSRYCLPLVPVLVLFLYRGVEHTAQWLTRTELRTSLKSLLRKLVWAPVVMVLGLNLFWLSSFVWSRHPDSTRGLYGGRAPYTWAGFEETFAWVRENTKPDDLLASAYDPMYFLYTGRKAIRPALHRPATYFYPYGAARPDVGSAAEIRPQLVELGAKYLIIDPLDGYAERQATLQLMDDIVKAYGGQAQLVFTSSDGLHRVFRLSVR